MSISIGIPVVKIRRSYNHPTSTIGIHITPIKYVIEWSPSQRSPHQSGLNWEVVSIERWSLTSLDQKQIWFLKTMPQCPNLCIFYQGFFICINRLHCIQTGPCRLLSAINILNVHGCSYLLRRLPAVDADAVDAPLLVAAFSPFFLSAPPLNRRNLDKGQGQIHMGPVSK